MKITNKSWRKKKQKEKERERKNLNKINKQNNPKRKLIMININDS